MNEFDTYEYVVKQKNTGKMRLMKGLFVCGYALFVAVMMAVAVVSRLGAPIVALTPFGLALIIFLTWRYTSVEFEYSITSGEMTVSKIFGGRTRRELISFRLRDCAKIAPAAEGASAFRADETVSALSSPNAPDAYCAALEEADGKKFLIYFEATQKALRICHFYNAAATILTKVSK